MRSYCVSTLICILLIFSNSKAQNGKIVAREPLDILNAPQLSERLFENGKLKREYSYLQEVVVEKITYLSDGLKVTGYLAYPKADGPYPGIVYNRGGNREFASLNISKAAFILARIAGWGYVVAGSQFRGNDGGDGREEFGGADVNDVLNLIPLLTHFPSVDSSRLGIYGWSRGGMMTYLALTRTCRFKAAVVGGGLSDLDLMMQARPDTFETVYEENIPDYAKNPQLERDRRSAIKQVDRICKTTPILMLHGTADWRVVPQMALDLSRAFIDARIPHRLVLFEAGDHGLTTFRQEVNGMVRAWLEKFVRQGAPLPDFPVMNH